MSESWSNEEVEATVADYFAMLDKEIRSVPYSKTVHRRGLLNLLDGRSDGAVERKHQNISAILIELGFVYISGYKPLSNYQQKLYDVVSDRLTQSHALKTTLHEQVTASVEVPTVADILTAWTLPPTLSKPRPVFADRPPRPRRGVDYVAMEAANGSLGLAGEEFTVAFEKARLIHAGKDGLAERVEHVSLSTGDGLGYDIRSFETSGEDRLIEVKTTKYGPMTPFFVTRNEVAASQRERERFHLYRAYDFRNAPRLFSKQGPLEQSFQLDPTEYVATIG
ncbi:MAG: DUF3883 domain-containing protein [Vicinamibacteria bacterium]